MEAGAVGVFRRKEMALKIEGTIESGGKVYEATGEYRSPKKGEPYLTSDDMVAIASVHMPSAPWIILREVKPPHVYKVGDWVRVLRETYEGLNPKSVNTEHPIGSVRQVSCIMPNGLLGVDGSDWCLRPANVEPCDPPAPKYRPFANAEEFKPHRDRWVRSKHAGNTFRTTAYNDKHHWCDTDRDTWVDVLNDFVFDDDGSPCGVLITE